MLQLVLNITGTPLLKLRSRKLKEERISQVAVFPHVCKTIAVTPQEGLEICLLYWKQKLILGIYVLHII